MFRVSKLLGAVHDIGIKTLRAIDVSHEIEKLIAYFMIKLSIDFCATVSKIDDVTLVTSSVDSTNETFVTLFHGLPKDRTIGLHIIDCTDDINVPERIYSL